MAEVFSLVQSRVPADTGTAPIGARLCELREAWGQAHFEVADYLGCAPMTVYQYEQGELEPDDLVVARLAKFWGVTSGYLRGEPGAEREPPAVRRAKVQLRQYLLRREREFGPETALAPRAQVVVGFLMKAAPDHYTAAFIARRVFASDGRTDRVNGLLKQGENVNEFSLYQIARLSGIPERWFWQLHADLRKADEEPEMPPPGSRAKRSRLMPMF